MIVKLYRSGWLAELLGCHVTVLVRLSGDCSWMRFSWWAVYIQVDCIELRCPYAGESRIDILTSAGAGMEVAAH